MGEVESWVGVAGLKCNEASSENKLELEQRLHVIEKITRRTTGAKGNYSFTSNYKFETSETENTIK